MKCERGLLSENRGLPSSSLQVFQSSGFCEGLAAGEKAPGSGTVELVR